MKQIVLFMSGSIICELNLLLLTKLLDTNKIIRDSKYPNKEVYVYSDRCHFCYVFAQSQIQYEESKYKKIHVPIYALISGTMWVTCTIQFVLIIPI